MKKDKVLIKLFVPELDETYELFVPVNEIIWKLNNLICKSINELTDGAFSASSDILLMNKLTGYIYKSNEILFDTDIRNSTELILMKKSFKTST